jgi:hypothetical protein
MPKRLNVVNGRSRNLARERRRHARLVVRCQGQPRVVVTAKEVAIASLEAAAQ